MKNSEECSYEKELCDNIRKSLPKRTETRKKLSEKDNDIVFVEMMNTLTEDERLRVLLYCARRGFIAYR